MRLSVGGYLGFYLPGFKRGLELELPQPTPLLEILANLGIPPAEVHLAVVNGQNEIPGEALISDSDEVKLFSAVDGG